jgi:hypothetical protein
MALLEKSRPERDLSVSWEKQKGRTVLFRKIGGRKQKVCILNTLGTLIWERCDSRHSPLDISLKITEDYQVTHREAYRDVLEFLGCMKRLGTIRI